MDFMQYAIEYLNENSNKNVEIPVCAVLVQDSKIIATAINRKEEKKDVTSHAEIEVLRIASKKEQNWRLEDCEMYVTLEPCPMCAWAIIQSRLKAVYFGSYDLNYGALGSKLDLRSVANSKLKVYSGIKQEECDRILSDYFENIRMKNC